MAHIVSVRSAVLCAILLLFSTTLPLRSQQTAGRQEGRPVEIGGTGYAQASSFLFTENIGQWGEETAFRGRAGSVTVRFRAGAVDYYYKVDSLGKGTGRRSADGALLTTEFLGAEKNARIEGADATDTRFNFYLGGTGRGSHSGARVFNGVRYVGLYPGIDALYTGAAGSMKYEFVVAAGADPDMIRLAYRGARSLAVTPKGELEATTGFGTVTDAAPYCYQEIGGVRREVHGAYRLLGGDRYGFRLGAYDRAYPVVIDPCLSIEYGTYLGGGGYDVVTNMAVDSAGFAYAVGYTNAVDFPLEPGRPYPESGNYIFISKLAEDGSRLIYSTMIAQPYAGPYTGTGMEVYYESIGEDVEVTADGEAVLGLTTNIPKLETTPGAYGGAITPNDVKTNCAPLFLQNYDFYLARLSASGEIRWASYLGGRDDDYLRDIALDAAGNVCVTGMTFAPRCGAIGDTLAFPVTVPKETFSTTDTLKGFETTVAKLSADGGSLIFGAVYGGSGNEFASKIAVDGDGKIYLFGSTNSNDLKTTPNGYRTSAPGRASGAYDLYIARIDPATSTLDYGSYFTDGTGGNRPGLGVGVFYGRVGLPLGGFDVQHRHQGFALDRQPGVVVFGGSTRSSTLQATPGAFRAAPPSPGEYDGFVVRMDLTTNNILAATYIGGSGADYVGGVSVDAYGDIAVGVSTTSSNFPLTSVVIQDELNGKSDAAIAVLTSDGRNLEYGSFIGGSAPSGPVFQWEQSVTGILTERTGALYLYGATSSRDLPISNTAFMTDNDYYSGYIIKFTGPTSPRVGSPLHIEFPPNACTDIAVYQQQIFNSGQAPLRIDSITTRTGRYFKIVDAPNYPIFLDPCDTFTVSIGFQPDEEALCDRTLRDSMLIHAGNAVLPRTAVGLSGVKRCISFKFMETTIDDPRYWLGSDIQYHFRASVQGEIPQYLTIEPDPGNQGIFKVTPPQINQVYLQGSAFVDFEVNAPDTGRYCETFTATILPCERKVKLSICAYVKSGFFNAIPDSIAYGPIACGEIEQPITIYNSGNDTLRWRLWFVGGPNGEDIEHEPNLGFFRPLPEKDSTTFMVHVRPKGVGERTAILVFETNERVERRNPKLTITSELDTVSFRLTNPSLVGGYGEILDMPITYEPIREGRVPATELSFLAKFDPSLLAVVGMESDGTMTEGWEIDSTRVTGNGTFIRLRMTSTGRPLTGAGTLTNLRLKVLRGDTVETGLGVELAGISKGCMNADVDTTQLFMLSEECRAYDRLLLHDARFLKQSVPNPASDDVWIPFRVPEAGRVTLVLYDMLGREALRLIDEERPVSQSEGISFPAHTLPPGRYYYRLTIGPYLSDTREMVIQ